MTYREEQLIVKRIEALEAKYQELVERFKNDEELIFKVRDELEESIETLSNTIDNLKK